MLVTLIKFRDWFRRSMLRADGDSPGAESVRSGRPRGAAAAPLALLDRVDVDNFA